MGNAWLGVVSALGGVLLGAVVQALRERAAHRRQLRTRWDETLLLSLVDYLAAADRAVRSLRRAWILREEQHADADECREGAMSSFEDVHVKSHAVTLLTGDPDDPVRAAARRVRAPLLPLRDDLEAPSGLTREALEDLVRQHHRARQELVRAAHLRLGVRPSADP